jgi:hypothetical protein
MSQSGGFKKAIPTANKGITIGANRPKPEFKKATPTPTAKKGVTIGSNRSKPDSKKPGAPTPTPTPPANPPKAPVIKSGSPSGAVTPIALRTARANLKPKR